MGRISAFEGLRGVMACWVMLFHIAAFSGMSFANAIQPDIPVDVFILISGFVIAHLFTAKDEPYGQFIFRRFMRLYPIYLLALALAIGLTEVYRHIIFDSPLSPFMGSQQERQTEVDEAFLVHIAVHLTLLHGALPDAVLPRSSMAILSPAWSISLEWQFYLIAPFVIGWIKTLRRFFIALTLAYIGFWLIRLSGLEFGKPSFILQRLPHFILGIGAYLFYFKLLHEGKASPRQSKFLLIIGTVCAVALASQAVFIGFLFLLAISWPLNLRGGGLASRIDSALSSHWVVAVGAASYSIYILHVPIIWLVLHFLMPVVGGNRYGIFAIMLAVVPAVTIAISMQTYRYVEKPLMRLRLTPRVN
ncbi:acyltransferase [Tistrella bauzanensis]|uniref:Acyltransferase n=1 Tax=Tistrella arctica TaxID=3133430 RepID=A0ABU9YS19_9PROT